MINKAYVFFICFSMNTTLHAQLVKGNAILGLNPGDRAGCSVSMPDAFTIAVGAYYHDSIHTDAGQVRVFSWVNNNWIIKGKAIIGAAADDRFGNAVSMPDANTLAIGAVLNDGGGINRGHVRVYRWNGVEWIQKGNNINGESDSSNSGNSISMPDSNTLAVGAYANTGDSGTASGHVRIFEWKNNSWVQKGADIDGSATGDFSGNSVSMPDANTVAIGALQHDDNGTDVGQVRVFTWNGINWQQKGDEVVGQAPFDRFGWSVHMADANTMAVGSPYHDANGMDAGLVKVLVWNGVSWQQKGSDLYGDNAGDRAGWTVMMLNENLLAFGCSGSDANGVDAGEVRIVKWNGTSWQPYANKIYGQTAGDRFGWSISMPDENTIAAGAPFHATNGMESGQARIFNLSSTTSTQSMFINDAKIQVFPQPNFGSITIDLDKVYSQVQAIIYDANGNKVLTKECINCQYLNMNESLHQGIYWMEIIVDDKKYFKKLVVL